MSTLQTARRWLPPAVFVLLSCVGSAGWWLATSRDIAAASDLEHQIAEQTALRVRDWVDARLTLVGHVERLKLEGRLDGQEGWAWLDPMVQAPEGIQAVNWIDARGVIVALSPSEGNEKALNRSIYDHDVAGPHLRAAFASGVAQASAPLDLFQGGRGFTVYQPVKRDGAVLGAVNGVFRVEALERLCFAELAEAHSIVLRDGPHLLSRMGPERDRARIVSAQVPVLNRVWTLEIEPSEPGPSFARSAPVLGVLLLGFLVVGLLLHAVLRREEEAENTLRSRQAMAMRLQETERLEALGRLAGAVAHDVNNVLTVIRAHMDLLAEAAPEGITVEEANLHAEAVDDAAERGAALTSKLLAFARKQPVTRGTVEIAGHVRGLRRMLHDLAGPNCEVTLRVPKGELVVDFPADSVDRVLVNLVVNARDALEGGAGAITVSVEPEGELVLLTVEDDGLGMADDVLSKVFEPFFTTRAEGTGLGLAAVHGLVTQAGGTVHLTSAVGVGTRVEIRLRLADRDAPEPPSLPRSPGPEEPTTKMRVLVVEDDPLVRRALVLTITAQGYDVLPFADAEEAIAHAPRSDVLVTDLVLPGMTGATLARKLRDRWPSLRIVVVSGYASQPGDADEIVAAGAAFLPKPYSPRELAVLLASIGAEIVQDAAEGDAEGDAEDAAEPS